MGSKPGKVDEFGYTRIPAKNYKRASAGKCAKCGLVVKPDKDGGFIWLLDMPIDPLNENERIGICAYFEPNPHKENDADEGIETTPTGKIIVKLLTRSYVGLRKGQHALASKQILKERCVNCFVSDFPTDFRNVEMELKGKAVLAFADEI